MVVQPEGRTSLINQSRAEAYGQSVSKDENFVFENED